MNLPDISRAQELGVPLKPAPPDQTRIERAHARLEFALGGYRIHHATALAVSKVRWEKMNRAQEMPDVDIERIDAVERDVLRARAMVLRAWGEWVAAVTAGVADAAVARAELPEAVSREGVLLEKTQGRYGEEAEPDDSPGAGETCHAATPEQ